MREHASRRTRAIIRRALAPLLLLLLLLAAVLLSAAPALAAGSSISGTVVNGTKGGRVGGLEVTLHMYQGEAEAGTRTSATSPDGRFRFTGMATGAGWSYQVTTTYQGADYQTAKVELASGESRTVDLKVYEATRSPAHLTQTNWAVWVDREGKGVAVQQDLDIRNSGKTTYVGNEAVPGGKRAVLRLSLAPGARNFQYLGFFMECCALVRGTTLIHTMPIDPGTSQGTLRYNTGSVQELAFPVTFPTKTFSLLVPVGVTATSSQLAPVGQTQDRGVTYQVYAASDLRTGESVRVTLAGLGGRRLSSLAAVAVGFGAFAAAGVVWLALAVRRRRGTGEPRRRVAARSPGAHPARERPPAGAAAAGSRDRRPGHRRAAEARRLVVHSQPSAGEPSHGEAGSVPQGEDELDLLVEEIAALDLAFERGVLDEATYRRVRAAAKTRLLEFRARARTGPGSGNGKGGSRCW